MNHAIILAAGQGQRMKSKEDKMLVHAGGHPVIYFSLMAFSDHPEIDSVTVVANKSNKKAIEDICKIQHFPKVKKVVLGGLTRQKSFENGFSSLGSKVKKDDIILVHNGANPLVSLEEISEVISKTAEVGGCIVGHIASSTIKEVDGEKITKTHNRDRIFEAQTPQAARYFIFKKALEHAKKKRIEVTDESALLENINQKVAYLEAGENNFKITTQADLTKLRGIMGDLPKDFRVGIGQDSHMFEKGVKGLILGGVEFENESKLQANSDGDVILHAIFNALSQAIGDMSLGFYADEACEKGVKDSKKYLEIILKKIKKEKFKINSLGLMMECKVPKIDPIVGKLKKSLSQILDLPSAKIGITATSGEHMTIFGAGMGIQCFAIASLVKA